MFSSLFGHLAKNKHADVNEEMFRKIVLDTIRSLNVKFREQYGELVLAADSTKYWRKTQFPYYKASRRKARDASGMNWPEIFKAMKPIIAELKNVFPYKYIEIETAEADDIIAVICASANQPTLILSSDKDYIQLQSNPNVTQYDPVNKRFLSSDNPKKYLFDHILKGDSGDGIPNVASADNCLVIGERQKKMTANLVESLQQLADQPNHPLYRNFIRNKMLIDLTEVPLSIRQAVEQQISETNKKSRSGLWKFFAEKGMRQLSENVNDF